MAARDQSPLLTPFVAAREFLTDVCGDQLAVEASILDENLVRLRARDNHPGHVDSGHVALQRLRIATRTELLRGQLDPDAAEKVVIRMVSRESEYVVVVDARRPRR